MGLSSRIVSTAVISRHFGRYGSTQVYMPWPEASTLRQVVDLGANIGFTSIYLYRRLTVEYLIAVEPDPDNVRVLRQN